MIYYKTKRGKIPKSLKCNTEAEAKIILGAIGVKLENVEFLTKGKAVKLLKKKKPKTPEELFEELPEVSKKIWEDCLCNDRSEITDDVIGEYDLRFKLNKPYYISSYWGSGGAGHFANLEDIKNTYYEKLKSPFDESFAFTVYSTETFEEVYFKIELIVEPIGE